MGVRHDPEGPEAPSSLQPSRVMSGTSSGASPEKSPIFVARAREAAKQNAVVAGRTDRKSAYALAKA